MNTRACAKLLIYPNKYNDGSFDIRNALLTFLTYMLARLPGT